MEKRARDDDEPEDDDIPFAPIPGFEGLGGAVGDPQAVPPRTPEHLVCMRGPCRHYWHVVTMAQEGNPEDTWEHLGIEAPRAHHYVCLVNPGMETEFTDDTVYECSRWEPMTEGELVQLGKRRRSFYQRHPEFCED
jgi:hypothetical protein